MYVFTRIYMACESMYMACETALTYEEACQALHMIIANEQDLAPLEVFIRPGGSYIGIPVGNNFTSTVSLVVIRRLTCGHHDTGSEHQKKWSRCRGKRPQRKRI